jgi:uncharacterized protein YecT (DUF1311 family)
MLLLALALPVGAASAQPVPQATAPCAEAAANDMMKPCLAKYYAETDRQMAEAYKAALVRVDASGIGRNLVMDWKRALQDTQRKWIAFREADCGPPISYETKARPEMQGIEHLRCKIAHTADRLAVLKSRYGAP